MRAKRRSEPSVSPKWVTSAVGGPCAKTAVLHPRIIASIIMMMVVMIIIMLIGIMMTMVTITVMIVVMIITDAQHPMPPGQNAAFGVVFSAGAQTGQQEGVLT